MSRPLHSRSAIGNLARDTRGAALVEFALALPILLLVFGVIVEGTRMMWSYQSAITGVRDATRYLARVVPSDICNTDPTGASLADHQAKLEQIVGGDDDRNMFPSMITVDSVTPSLACEDGPTFPYRNNPAPVATVAAQMTISFPLGELFEFAGSRLPDVTTTVSDASRIFGT